MVPTSKPKTTPPSDNNSTDGPLSFEKVWLMFQETDKKFKETDEKFKETDKKFPCKTALEIDPGYRT